MDFKVPKHNTPVSTLIKNYMNKKSGKVAVSRREIENRFNGMEWRHQKKILLAFINGSDSEREWASRKMFAFWDKSFIPVVKSLWEQYHESPLSWLILRYFPKEYLKQNMDSLSKGRNYYYLCQRLVDEEDFVIDKSRIYESDLIELFTIMKKPVSDEEISEVFYSMLSKICKGSYKSSYMNKWNTEGRDIGEVSILDNQKVNHILLCIEFTLGRKKLVSKIMLWNSRVMRDFQDSITFRMLKQMGIQRQESINTYMAWLKRFYLKHLEEDNVYNIEQEEVLFELSQSQINEQKIDIITKFRLLNMMRMKNPALNNMLDTFSLDFVDPL